MNNRDVAEVVDRLEAAMGEAEDITEVKVLLRRSLQAQLTIVASMAALLHLMEEIKDGIPTD